MRPPGIIDAFLEAESIELASVAAALAGSDPTLESIDLDALIALSARLPAGLVHAEEIWALAEPPRALPPLSPGSSWYALGRSLAAVVPPGREPLLRLVADLGTYAAAASHLQRRLDGEEALVDQLLAPAPLPPDASTRLALLLDAKPESAAALDARAPGLRADLGWMAREGFVASMRLHASVRPARARMRGAAIARALLADLPPGPLQLLVTERPEAVDHLSPYVRDLGHALTAWGLENAQELTTAGLAAALNARKNAPDADLASAVASDLLARHPDLAGERRAAERTTGLRLEDDRGTVWGWTDVALLDAADVQAVASGAAGVLAIVAGGAHETLVEAARALFEAGRVARVALVLGCARAPSPVLLARAFVAEDDGFLIRTADGLAARAQSLGIACAGFAEIPIDASVGAPPILIEMLRLIRRAHVRGAIAEGLDPIVVLHARPRPGVAPDVDLRLGPIRAARLALAALLENPQPRSSLPSNESDKLPKSVRFRV